MLFEIRKKVVLFLKAGKVDDKQHKPHCETQKKRIKRRHDGQMIQGKGYRKQNAGQKKKCDGFFMGRKIMQK